MKHTRWFAVAALAVLAVAGAAAASPAGARPSEQQIEFAREVYGLMLNELVAALFQEFNETTPANVEHGKLAISLIFNDANRDMRLVGSFGPLLGRTNNRPADAFEEEALARALAGQPHESVERVKGRWYYRRSFALSNTFHAACVQCHTNFTPQFFEETQNPGQWVGTLVQRVPIRTEE